MTRRRHTRNYLLRYSPFVCWKKPADFLYLIAARCEDDDPRWTASPAEATKFPSAAAAREEYKNLTPTQLPAPSGGAYDFIPEEACTSATATLTTSGCATDAGTAPAELASGADANAAAAATKRQIK